MKETKEIDTEEKEKKELETNKRNTTKCKYSSLCLLNSYQIALVSSLTTTFPPTHRSFALENYNGR